MQSSHKVLSSLMSKIKSPLAQISNRAITTLYTKVAAQIISSLDLIQCKQLPGVLFYWVNQTSPINKENLYKILKIIHKYVLTDEGIKILFLYQALQFLQEFRKFLMANETNVEQHVDLIRKIIKQLLPMQNQRQTKQMQNKQQKQLNEIQQNEPQEDFKKSLKKDKSKSKQKKSNQTKKPSNPNILIFNVLTDHLPKPIDQQLYSLVIQLKHGKKQSILQSLCKIQKIMQYWGYRYFGYKDDLIKQLVIIAQGKIYSDLALTVLSSILKQLIQMHEDLNDHNNHKMLHINQINKKTHIHLLQIQINFQIFQDNPFAYVIFDAFLNRSQPQILQSNHIQYLIIAISKYSFSVNFLPLFLQKIYKNKEWTSSELKNRQKQDSFYKMIDHSCDIQPQIATQIIPILIKIFADKSLEQLCNKIPNLSAQLQQGQLQKSFQVLVKYIPKQNEQTFDFNISLHQLQSHIKNLQSGLNGLAKNPSVISLYIDCLLMLAIAVARQDPLMSFYPKIKSLILKISLHQYLSCRVSFYQLLLMTFNSSSKANYLSQSYQKSELIRLVFIDGEFYQQLLKNSLNQQQTIGQFLEVTKLIQTTTKQENHKYINKFTSIYYLLSLKQSSKQLKSSPSISACAKTILSRISKKYHIINLLLSMFSSSKQIRLNTYTSILGLSNDQDILPNMKQYMKRSERKLLKYSLSTIKNYMNIISNHNIQKQVKKSAFQEMIQCVLRIDLSLLQNDSTFLSELLSIRQILQHFIKDYVQKPSKNGDLFIFVQLVRIYSILQKRLRLQTKYLDQSIKPLTPQMHLNILINVCGSVSQDSIQIQSYKNVIPQFMLVVYIHSLTTFTSNLILNQQNQKSQISKNQIKVHWITSMFAHQQILKLEKSEPYPIAKRLQISLTQSLNKRNAKRQKMIDSFVKVFQSYNIKSLRQLLQVYIDKISQLCLSQPSNKLQSKIICPILQRELSQIIHNINTSHNQLSLLSFFILQLGTKDYNILNELHQIVPHLFNQLIKPNLGDFSKNILIKIINRIGWKKTKQIQSILSQIDQQQLYLLQIIKHNPKVTSEELNKIIKIVLNNSQNLINYSNIYLVYKILLQPQNIKIIITNLSQYSRMILLNCLVKSIQNPVFDCELTKIALILLYTIINEVLKVTQVFQMQQFDSINSEYKQQSNFQVIKLTSSLSIGPNLMSFFLSQFQSNSSQAFQSNSSQAYNVETTCYLLETLKLLYKLTDKIQENSLTTTFQVNLSHQTKILKLFIAKIVEIATIHNNQRLVSYYSSVFNFCNVLTKTKTFYKTLQQIDILDLSISLFHQKTKKLQQSQDRLYSQHNQIMKLSEVYLFFCSILQYIYLKIDVDQSETSHYLLSSSGLLEGCLQIVIFLNKKSQLTCPKTNSYMISLRKQLIEKIAKVLHSVSIHQEDYFVFKFNQISQQNEKHYDLFQLLGNLVQFADLNFIIFFMRIILIWQSGKSIINKKQVISHKIISNLNSIDIFQQDEQQQDDSSLQQRQLYQTTKASYQSHWIYKTINICLQRNQISHCKSLVALSIPAKIFLLQKQSFNLVLKKYNHLIDSRIIYQSGKKKNNKKAGTSVLGNSRRTVISQQNSHINLDHIKISNDQNKITQIQDCIKLLTSLFCINDTNMKTQQKQFFLSKFTKCTSVNRQAMKRIFTIVDKLYNLCQLMLNNNCDQSICKSLSMRFSSMIRALSVSSLFSYALSNHLNEICSPMLDQSLQTILKVLSSCNSSIQYQRLKQSFELLTTLSNHESVRSFIFKNKLIEELNSRLIKYDEKRTERNQFINLNTLYDIVKFYINLARFKDSHVKILNDKRVLEILVNQVYIQKSTHLSQKIIQLLSNLCAYKSNKVMFVQNREIHKTILGQLQSSQIQYKSHLLILLYNLMYRHAPSVKLYKRKDVVDMLKGIQWDKCQNWDQKKRQVYQAVMQVLQSQQNIVDKA